MGGEYPSYMVIIVSMVTLVEGKGQNSGKRTVSLRYNYIS
jgi:hypothetical protein